MHCESPEDVEKKRFRLKIRRQNASNPQTHAIDRRYGFDRRNRNISRTARSSPDSDDESGALSPSAITSWLLPS
jgi:hypothetical protein